MKKFLSLLAAVVFTAMSANAQTNVYLSTNGNAINFSKINASTQRVSLSRIFMAGYNTICLPFSVSAEELRAAVGEDVQIERLVKAEGNILYFLDVTNEGIQAGDPYLIFSPTRKVATFMTSETNMVEPRTITVGGASMFSSYQKETPTGVYGIPAMQDTDILQSVLIKVDGEKSFLPTRCGFSSTSENPEIRHITSLDQTTGINTLVAQDAVVDVYTVGGSLVKSGITMRKAMSSLQKGMYVVNGQKFLVK